MTSRILSSEERERILRTIEESREFRHALMGLLGFKEILERITKLEERFARIEERQIKLEERQQALEERFARIEERFAKIEERMTRLEREMEETRRVVMVIAHRFGVISEETFRQALKYVVEETLGAGVVEKWVYNDLKGVVYGYPSVVEVDILVKNGIHILVEVKSRVSRGDVLELHKIGKLYEEVKGVKPKLVIIGGFIDRGVTDIAMKLGVEVRPITKDFSLL